jgi:hypothetical protein
MVDAIDLAALSTGEPEPSKNVYGGVARRPAIAKCT